MDLRRKKIRLSEDNIRAMLRFPAGTDILAVRGQFDPPSIEVLVHRDDWPAITPDTEAPLAMTYQQVIDDRLLITFPELGSEDPEFPSLRTEYQWQGQDGISWRDVPRDHAIRWFAEHGGKVRMRLVSDWDEMREDGDQ